jgi:hypothetical protein
MGRRGRLAVPKVAVTNRVRMDNLGDMDDMRGTRWASVLATNIRTRPADINCGNPALIAGRTTWPAGRGGRPSNTNGAKHAGNSSTFRNPKTRGPDLPATGRYGCQSAGSRRDLADRRRPLRCTLLRGGRPHGDVARRRWGAPVLRCPREHASDGKPVRRFGAPPTGGLIPRATPHIGYDPISGATFSSILGGVTAAPFVPG